MKGGYDVQNGINEGRETGATTVSEEFRIGAVRLVLDAGKTVGAVARELDLTPSALAQWVKQARADRTKTGLDRGAAELARLRKDNRELRMERDVLLRREVLEAGWLDHAEWLLRLARASRYWRGSG